MVRPVVRASNRATEMEIKTLKLSYDTQTNVRAPMVWEKPTAGLYNYHYEIDGLYYQPMISYCIGRSNGARRKVVDIPDRILSNYDKRSYKLKLDNDVDYEGFLTNTYQRRMKDVNSKKIHCANESVQRSKKTTDLGMARGSAMMRDKYLNQVQMMYTEKLAREGKMKGLEVENFGSDKRSTRSQSVECEVRGENKLLSRKRNDARYGPAYERITTLESEQYNRGEFDSFLPAAPRRAVSEERVVVKESAAAEEAETTSKTVRVVKTTNIAGEVSEEVSKTEGGNKKVSLINRDYLAADNMNEFLKVRNTELLMKEAVADGPAAPLFYDATFSKAIKDVRNRVKKEGNKCFMPKTQIDDLKINYRGKTMYRVGAVEKAFIRSTMYNRASIPDIDVGYDVIG